MTISQLQEHLDQCPTAYHVAQYWAKRLTASGFSDQSGTDELNAARGFRVRGGSIVAWNTGANIATSGFRIIGAHSDSPGLHLKPHPEKRFENISLLGVEIYGSPLLNSWLDRDLGIAGIVVCADGLTRVFRTINSLARISQLAIHLDRDVNDKGLVLDKHQHLNAMWSTSVAQQSLNDSVAKICEIDPRTIVSLSAQFFDTQPSSIFGVDQDFLASARLDNQISCWAAMEALVANSSSTHPSVVALFDHEEVGSASATGAASPLLEHVLERLCLANGCSRHDFLTVLSKSHCVSADNAHAVHPNYSDKHDINHAPLLNCGVVIKTNVNQRYASSPDSLVPFIRACQQAKVPIQQFASRNNIACGSTIGPITATRLGIDTVDVGVPQLSMHSAREVCGSKDPIYMREALSAYLAR